MEKQLNRKKLALTGFIMLGLPLVFSSAVYAAKPVNLSHESVSMLQSFALSPAAAAVQGAVNISEISRSVDFNQTLHVRVQETYAGYPVWGADAIMHIPNGTKTPTSLANTLTAVKNNHGYMNGTFYQDIKADLAVTPSLILKQSQAKQVLQTAVETYQAKVGGKPEVKDQQTNLIVYMDKANKAHWAYKVSFYAAPLKMNSLPAKPVYIIDATTAQIYAQWDDIKTMEYATLDDSVGGGYGGNIKMGKLVYDGLAEHLSKLTIKRDAAANKCYMQNADVIVKNYKGNKVMTFNCKTVDAEHNSVYWSGDLDAVNDGYSPSNDALFGGNVIKDMYQKWYNVPVLEKDGKPMKLTMVVHDPIDNAYWDGAKMTFGDGVSYFYPLTSLGVAAHEISHGFTEQHSNLTYSGHSGGMNESYSDMAAQAAEIYAYGKNSWQIGPEIFKAEGEALRYMVKPSKDCGGSEPGNSCSIDNANQYYDGLDVHYSSGVYNRLFYLMATSTDWTVKKAFDVMIQANQHHWTRNSTFSEGACGIIKATKDYNYDVVSVKAAIKEVGIDISQC